MKKNSTFLKEKSFSNNAMSQNKFNEKTVILSSDFSTTMPATVRSYKKFMDLLVTSITTEGLLTLCNKSK